MPPGRRPEEQQLAVVAEDVAEQLCPLQRAVEGEPTLPSRSRRWSRRSARTPYSSSRSFTPTPRTRRGHQRIDEAASSRRRIRPGTSRADVAMPAAMASSMRGKKRRPSISNSKRLPSRQGKRNLRLVSGMQTNISHLALFRRHRLRYRRPPMAEPTYVFDATADNFRTLVLANSEKDRWWSIPGRSQAGPCRMLMPRLLRWPRSSAAGSCWCGSIPTTLGGWRATRRVTSIYDDQGVSSRQGQARRWRGVGGEPARVSAQAPRRPCRRAARDGTKHSNRAIPNAPPRSRRRRRSRSRTTRRSRWISPSCWCCRGRYAQAEALLAALPPPLRERPELRHCGCTPVFSMPPARRRTRKPSSAPSPPTRRPDARYRLGAVRLTQDDYEAAMAQLPKSPAAIRLLRGGIGREGLLTVFSLLGDGDTRVQHLPRATA